MMAYYLDEFDTQALPHGDSVDGLGTGAAPSSLVTVAGGVIDTYGADEIVPLPFHQIWHRGIYSANVEANVNGLRALLGQRKKLFRIQESDSVQQWKWARLLSVIWDRNREQRSHAEVDAIFEAVGWWKATAPESPAPNVTDTGSLVWGNDGNAYVTDGIFTFAATSAATLTMTVVDTGNGINWTWVGAMASGESVVIDCGAFSVLNNEVDAYSGLTLNAGHTSNYWMVAAPGSNTWSVTLSAEPTGALSLTVYDSWV